VGSTRLAPSASATPPKPHQEGLVERWLRQLIPTDRDRVERAGELITRLDVGPAKTLLDQVKSDAPAVRFQRGRLALYSSDCDTAAGLFAAAEGGEAMGGLRKVAEGCAGATAGAKVVVDEQRGLWFRLQEDGDEALLPWLSEVSVAARSMLERDLGVVLPRPMRIDLVRDLFSLSKLTGLPLEAAETTGTVGVARFGRVTMLSPRAIPGGYGWEDTFVHELTHLAVTRGSTDRAPLWLQEGVAKREEIRWRATRPFDRDGSFHAREALRAALSGRSVGLDKLGPSIAMLPSAEQAGIAFAEVASFIDFFVARQGPHALGALLADLAQLDEQPADDALRSVSGFTLGEWSRLWSADLRARKEELLPSSAPLPSASTSATPLPPLPSAEAAGLVRRPLEAHRAATLLLARGFRPAAAALAARGVVLAPRWPELRALTASALAEADERAARAWLGDGTKLERLHGPWCALAGRFELVDRRHPEAERWFRLAVSNEPFDRDVACEGRGADLSFLPEAAARRALCIEARGLPRD
jgi:hypothetical protein